MPAEKNGAGWIVLGLALLMAGTGLTAHNWQESLSAGRSSEEILSVLETLPHEDPAETDTEHAPIYPEEMPVKNVNGVDLIGTLWIPALELELPVIHSWSDANLQIAPCRYSGSVYSEDLILCGHNYPTHFGGLSRLLPGDRLTFTDMLDNCFCYEMEVRETLLPEDMTAIDEGNWGLTLFTCTPGGQSRVVIRCTHSQTDLLEKTPDNPKTE